MIMRTISRISQSVSKETSPATSSWSWDTPSQEEESGGLDLSDEDIRLRLVALNKEHAAEEASGHIRWLRPEYQNPTGKAEVKREQTAMDVGIAAHAEKAPWPKAMPDQFAAMGSGRTQRQWPL